MPGSVDPESDLSEYARVAGSSTPADRRPLDSFQPHDRLPDYLLRHTELHPARVAVEAGERQLTYGELGAESSRLATRLREAGAAASVVAIRADRSIEMVV